MANLNVQSVPKEPVYEFQIDACPEQLLKSVQSLKKMGLAYTVLQLQFNTIDETQLFTQILNREQEEQKVANELKTTFFHNIRGKIKKVQINKDEEFHSMKKIKFNSAYHATLFLKYYANRVSQIQNQYKYILTSGRDGFLNVYIIEGQISKMFLNQIRDMKKRLQFYEIRTQDICQRFIYSQKLGNQLIKQEIFHQAWYKGRQSTIIFYSQKHNLIKMKSIIDSTTKYHLTILKMADYRFSFLINYFLFKIFVTALVKDEMYSFRSAQLNQIQFNQNKLAIVVHDYHQIFASQIVEEIFQKSKCFILMAFKAKNSRKFYNSLKKQFICQKYLSFNYSKKNVCLCINKNKIQSYSTIKKMFNLFVQSIDQQSQITFNWFHLQQSLLQSFRQHLVKNYTSLLSNSRFYIQNFEKFYEKKDLKCILKYKDFSQSKNKIGEQISQVLTNMVKIWGSQQTIVQKKQHQNIRFQYPLKQVQAEDQHNQQSDSGQQSQYEIQEQEADNKIEKDDGIIKQTQIDSQFLQGILKIVNQQFVRLKDKLFSQFQIEQQKIWAQSKSFRSLQQYFDQQTKVITKVRLITIHQSLKQKFDQYRQCNSQDQNYFIHLKCSESSQNQQNSFKQTKLSFCQLESMPNDLKWKDEIEKTLVYSVQNLQPETTYIACQQIGKIWYVPLFMLKIIKSYY